MRMIPTRILFLALAVPALACAAAEPTVDYEAEEQAIRDIVAGWNQAVADGDVEAITALYAEDGYIAPPGADRAQGPEAVAAVWTGLLSLPELELNIESAEIEVARAGDLAYENGTYTMSFAAGEDRVEDHGKYLVVWQKQDGEWKVVADLFNTSVPTQ